MRFAHIEAAVLRLSVVKRCIADPVLPAKICRLDSSLMFLQDRNDLLYPVLARLIPSPPVQITRELQLSLIKLFGAGHRDHIETQSDPGTTVGQESTLLKHL